MRKGNWKLVSYQVADPAKTTTELYDLTSDLGEEHNVAAEQPEIVAELLKLMAGASTPSELFMF